MHGADSSLEVSTEGETTCLFFGDRLNDKEMGSAFGKAAAGGWLVISKGPICPSTMVLILFGGIVSVVVKIQPDTVLYFPHGWDICHMHPTPNSFT